MGLQEGLHWNRGQRVPSRNSSTITPTVALEDDPEGKTRPCWKPEGLGPGTQTQKYTLSLFHRNRGYCQGQGAGDVSQDGGSSELNWVGDHPPRTPGPQLSPSLDTV